MSLVSVVCCQVEVSATSWSLVQRSPNDCGVSQMCVTMKPRRNEEAQAHIGLSNHRKKKDHYILNFQSSCRLIIILKKSVLWIRRLVSRRLLTSSIEISCEKNWRWGIAIIFVNKFLPLRRYIENSTFNLHGTSNCMLRTGQSSCNSKVLFALSKAGTIRLTQGMAF
jgi:hypothetical protein